MSEQAPIQPNDPLMQDINRAADVTSRLDLATMAEGDFGNQPAAFDIDVKDDGSETMRLGGTEVNPTYPRVDVATNEYGESTVNAQVIKVTENSENPSEIATHEYQAKAGGEDAGMTVGRTSSTGEKYEHRFKDPDVAKKFGSLITKHVESRAKAELDERMSRIRTA